MMKIVRFSQNGHTPRLGCYVHQDEVMDLAASCVAFLNTRNFIFDVRYLVSYLSQLLTLSPGDLIATGTPAGVGFSRKPPVVLQPGDTVRLEITGLGVLENPVKDA
jgi:2-keto-4-pentenoate hydratase/2-oxohepta-3-ene-1,7-dioic acid hydratase in catechol pathway